MKKRLVRILAIASLLFAILPVSTAFAATYSVTINQAAAVQDSHSTVCADDTCDESEVLFNIDTDVSGRGIGSANAVAIDVCIFLDSDEFVSSATVTGTGTFYTGSYINDNTWNCGSGSSGTLGTVTTGTGWKCGAVGSDQMFCKIRIDDDTNAVITLSGRENSPYECDSAGHGSTPTYSRYVQADLYKHSDPTKSASDSDTHNAPCIDGNTEPTSGETIYPNGSGYFYPTGTDFKIYSLTLQTPLNTTPGPITYDLVYTTPSWVVITSCPITANGSTWYSPNNPPTCSITGSGHTMTIHFTSDTSMNPTVDVNATIGSIPECPSMSTFSKHLFDDKFVSRGFDGSWKVWGPETQSFKCQL